MFCWGEFFTKRPTIRVQPSPAQQPGNVNYFPQQNIVHWYQLYFVQVVIKQFFLRIYCPADEANSFIFMSSEGNSEIKYREIKWGFFIHYFKYYISKI